MSIDPSKKISPLSLPPSDFLGISSSSLPDERVCSLPGSFVSHPFSATHTPEESFFYSAVQSGVLDHQGNFLLDARQLQIPYLSEKGLARLNARLDRTSGTVRKNLARLSPEKMDLIKIHFDTVAFDCHLRGIPNPFHLDFTNKTVEIHGLNYSLRGLLVYLLQNLYGRIRALEVNGSDLTSVVGPEFYRSAVEQLQNEALLEIFDRGLSEKFLKRGQDLDIKIYCPRTGYQELEGCVNLMLGYFVALLGGGQSGACYDDWMALVRELLFVKLKHVNWHFGVWLDHFYILSFQDIHGMKIDMTWIDSQIHTQLFHANGLSLNFMPLLTGELTNLSELVPRGEAFGGWQSILDRIAGVVGVSRMDVPFNHGWSRWLLALVKGNRFVNRFLEPWILQEAWRLPSYEIVHEVSQMVWEHHQGQFEALWAAHFMLSCASLSCRNVPEGFLENLWSALMRHYAPILKETRLEGVLQILTEKLWNKECSFVQAKTFLELLLFYRTTGSGATNNEVRFLEMGGRTYLRAALAEEIYLTLLHEVEPFLSRVSALMSSEMQSVVLDLLMKECCSESIADALGLLLKQFLAANTWEADEVCDRLLAGLKDRALRKKIGGMLIEYLREERPLFALRILGNFFADVVYSSNEVYRTVECMIRPGSSPKVLGASHKLLFQVLSKMVPLKAKRGQRVDVSWNLNLLMQLIDHLLKEEEPFVAHDFLVQALKKRVIHPTLKIVKEKWLEILEKTVHFPRVYFDHALTMISEGIQVFSPSMQHDERFQSCLLGAAQKFFDEGMFDCSSHYLTLVNPVFLSEAGRARLKELKFCDFERQIQSGLIEDPETLRQQVKGAFSEEQIQRLTVQWIDCVLKQSKWILAKEASLRMMDQRRLVPKEIFISLLEYFLLMQDFFSFRQLLLHRETGSVLNVEERFEYVFEWINTSGISEECYLSGLVSAFACMGRTADLERLLPHLFCQLGSVTLQVLQQEEWSQLIGLIEAHQVSIFTALLKLYPLGHVLEWIQKFRVWKIPVREETTLQLISVDALEFLTVLYKDRLQVAESRLSSVVESEILRLIQLRERMKGWVEGELLFDLELVDDDLRLIALARAVKSPEATLKMSTLLSGNVSLFLDRKRRVFHEEREPIDAEVILRICRSFSSDCSDELLIDFTILFFHLLMKHPVQPSSVLPNHPHLVKMVDEVLRRFRNFDQDELLANPRMLEFFDPSQMAEFWTAYFVTQVEHLDPRKKERCAYIYLAFYDKIHFLKDRPDLMSAVLKKLAFFKCFALHYDVHQVREMGIFDLILQNMAHEVFKYKLLFLGSLMKTQKILQEFNHLLEVHREEAHLGAEPVAGSSSQGEVAHLPQSLSVGDFTEFYAIGLINDLALSIAQMIHGNSSYASEIACLLEEFVFFEQPCGSQRVFQHHLTKASQLFQLACKSGIFREGQQKQFYSCMTYCSSFLFRKKETCSLVQREMIGDAVCETLFSGNVFKVHHAMRMLIWLSDTVYLHFARECLDLFEFVMKDMQEHCYHRMPIISEEESIQASSSLSHPAPTSVLLYQNMALMMMKDGTFFRKGPEAVSFVDAYVQVLLQLAAAPIPEGVDFAEDHPVRFLCEFLPKVLNSRESEAYLHRYVEALQARIFSYIDDPRLVDKKEAYEAYERLLFHQLQFSNLHCWIVMLLEREHPEDQARGKQLFEKALRQKLYVNNIVELHQISALLRLNG